VEKWQLIQRQNLPLEAKVNLTQRRIQEWVDHWGIDNVYVSFSGGKDSTVLLNICRKMYPEIKAAFCDTGLEYPEIRDFVKTFDNVDWIKPTMSFRQVILKYGYPIVSKEYADYIGRIQRNPASETIRAKVIDGICKNGKLTKFKLPKKWHYLIDSGIPIGADCCQVMKKSPLKRYEKKNGLHPIIGITAAESQRRTQNYLKDGCNAFNLKSPQSRPLSIWTEQDILKYIRRNNLPIAACYGEVVETDRQINLFGYTETELSTTKCKRTGCVFCGFGCHMEDSPNRFQRLKQTHPQLWTYCMKPIEQGGLGMKEVLTAYGVKYE
jgi:3'-phosphoadenosine 5'-phosphosulfate sulfotransferase (PAPS reductase)/FAD synthetase